MGCPSFCYIGDNLVFSVSTHNPSNNGVVTDADSVPTYRIYEDETETPILTGSMAKLDDANTTGFYTELIACTSGNGFDDGKTYTIYISATVSTLTGVITYGFKAIRNTVDGISRQEYEERLLAVADGNASRTNNVIDYLKQDGLTVKSQHTITSTSRTVGH